jgi:dipeptidyl aminopeptidase/acylaminoacyl peptidase
MRVLQEFCTRMNATAVFRAGLILQALLAWNGALAAEPIPVADFFRRPAVSAPVVSPSGQYAAIVVTGGPKRRQNLVIMNLQDPSKLKAVAAYVDADVKSVRWVNDDRLVFFVADAQAPGGEQIGEGLFTVDREGSESARTLIQRRIYYGDTGSTRTETGTRVVSPGLTGLHRFRSVLRDGSNDVIVEKSEVDGRVVDNRYAVTGTTLWRLDTVTGHARQLTFGGPDSVRHWALDRQGIPRVAVSVREGKSRLYWKATADAAWTLVMESDAFGAGARTPTPMLVDAKGMLYVTARAGKDADTRSLLRVDMSKPAYEGQALLSLDGYDFQGNLVLGHGGDVLGVRYLTDARGTAWLDPALKEIQKKVDGLLPGTINEIDCGECRNPGTVLVTSWSDHQPAIFRVYDAKAGTLSVVAASRPWIKAQAMARRDMLRITARDGLSMPVHVTRPVGQSGPAPTVVLVHGGPYMRGGEWKWDAQSQFLASRGYVVVEPEFRGSSGFGFRLFQAGWKQWGLAMQDDIADATLWAVKQGYADPKRICIAGASYGGYATLMGLIRYPELYRCGVNWVGVTDLDLMYTARWSDFSELWKEYGMPVLVGDPKKDAKQLADTSPMKLASKLTQPLLMAYGDVDYRVPIQHGVQLRDAVASHNQNLEWVTYADEGHGWVLEANDIDFWTRVEKFLDRHLRNAQ